ncbi:MAG: rod shape-determining protein MreC [Arcobacteraceae bacterium]|nr:rod shape-determining protein MreC [Campylobacterales bacterium]
MRKFIFALLFIIAGASYLFKIDELLIKKFTFLNDFKNLYISKVINFTTSLEKHFNQAETIEKLKIENSELKEYKILYTNVQNQLHTLKEFLVNIDIPENKSKIEIVKVLSYINYNDFTKVWLDKKIENDTILGLITDNYSAGIVVNKNGNAVGLLNGNKECSYAVFIGEEKAPGIITASKNQDELEIKFIPVWAEIKKGDEVITSGMDNIFFEGLKVGRVIQVTDLTDMKIATVKPYVNVLKKKYFYTYKSNNESMNTNLPKSENKK